MKAKWIGALALLTVGTVAQGHHSFAMFDGTKVVTLQGVVKEFQWTNPHAWIELQVTDKRGKTAQWSIEGGALNMLRRQGWTRTSLKPGDRVTVTINPLKNGQNGGSFVQVKLPDGRVLGQTGGLVNGRGEAPR